MGQHTAGFGQTVRRLRGKIGISQEELAARAGLHRTFISLIERGRRNPTLEVIHKLALGLGITAGELVSASENWAAA